MRIPIWAGGDRSRHGVPIRRAPFGRLLRAGFRLRRVNRFALHSASLRMTVLRSVVVVMAFVSSNAALANTYYVSSSTGSDSNPGTMAQPFQTLAKVNGLALAAGDSVFLNRGMFGMSS